MHLRERKRERGYSPLMWWTVPVSHQTVIRLVLAWLAVPNQGPQTQPDETLGEAGHRGSDITSCQYSATQLPTPRLRLRLRLRLQASTPYLPYGDRTPKLLPPHEHELTVL